MIVHFDDDHFATEGLIKVTIVPLTLMLSDEYVELRRLLQGAMNLDKTGFQPLSEGDIYACGNDKQCLRVLCRVLPDTVDLTDPVDRLSRVLSYPLSLFGWSVEPRRYLV